MDSVGSGRSVEHWWFGAECQQVSAGEKVVLTLKKKRKKLLDFSFIKKHLHDMACVFKVLGILRITNGEPAFEVGRVSILAHVCGGYGKAQFCGQKGDFAAGIRSRPAESHGSSLLPPFPSPAVCAPPVCVELRWGKQRKGE